MRREIKEEKEIKIKINGQKILVKQVKKWQYNKNDNPFVSKLNEHRWEALLSVKKGWETLNAEEFLTLLDENFEYGSYWVNDPNLTLEKYKNYIEGKFKTIKMTSSQPEITVVVLKAGISSINYTYALHLNQKKENTVNEALLLFNFNEDKISNLYMTDPDIYSFQTYRIGILDTNNEPRMFKHSATEERIGKIMNAGELLGFGIKIINDLLNETGKKVISVNLVDDNYTPHIIYENNNVQYYIKLLPFLPPLEDIDISYEDRFKISCFVIGKNAYTFALPIGFYCMDTFGGNPINGSTFAIKINDAIIC